MSRFLTLLVVALVASTAQQGVQTAPAQDLTFQVSSSQLWTDAGLDLQSGETIKISAEILSSSSSDGTTVSATPVCDPKGLSSGAGQTSDLPLPSAPAGALIMRLHAQGAAPLLVGAASELKVEEPSHLFLGLNVGTTSTCQGTVSVHVQRSPVPAQTETRGSQLKSQLASALQILMQGQFGAGKPEAAAADASKNASNATAANGAVASVVSLNVSDAPLDAELRRNIDSMPRRVNDQSKNLGDMVNFVIVGNEKDVQAALDAANWHVADTENDKAVLNAIMSAIDKKDYLQMPMSTLYLFGRKQDFGYEMAEPIAMVASRHHFRIWKAPFKWKDYEVWVGAGTHDVGFAEDKRNNGVTHKIDPAVDGERDNIGSSLQKANKTKTLTYYLPPNPVQDAKVATGDGYHSDGRLMVIFLQ